MLGQIGGIQVETPPAELLGRFDRPGDPEGILAWIRPRLGEYDAVVVSLDMLAYGGLIASRAPNATYEDAYRRIQTFWGYRLDHPRLKVYAFSAIMRLAPTATKESAAWRMLLARLAQVREQVRLGPTAANKRSLQNLLNRIPAWEVERYDAARARNRRLQGDILQFLSLGAFDYVSFGQDDAALVGPHVRETAELRRSAASFQVQNRTLFIQGIDQVPSVLLSRAALDAAAWRPKFRVSFSDEAARKKTAIYESAPIEESLRQQIVGAGASWSQADSDIQLYVNTPAAADAQVQGFAARIFADLAQGKPTAVADINLGKTGTPDERLVRLLMTPTGIPRLIGYAGWNTAANTMGTTIPAALIYEAARRSGANPLGRDLQMKRFLLHRLISDWQYHRFTRPLAYSLIDSMPTASREELYGEELDKVQELVRRDLAARADETFRAILEGATVGENGSRRVVTGIQDLQIRLPWPRAYEVKVDFQLGVSDVQAARRSR